MEVRTRAPSRAGLAGNPSDGYGGRVLAVAVEEYGAWAVLEPSRSIRIESASAAPLELSGLPDLLSLLPSETHPHRLALATCRRFFETVLDPGKQGGRHLASEGFRLRYGTDIPLRVGLAGSSAIVVTVLRALAQRYEVTIPDAELASLALEVEKSELGIHGGLMDRAVQVLGGLVYMDLAEELIARTGAGRYEALPPESLPPLFIAWSASLAAGSETVHNELRERFGRGEPDVLAIMRDLAAVADRARDALLAGHPLELVRWMDTNFELRARLVDVGEGNRRLVETGRRCGAGVKQAGSGGAVVGAFDGDPGRVRALGAAYADIGAHFLVPHAGV